MSRTTLLLPPPRRAADPSAWITAHRRLTRDYERDPALSEAMIRWAAINTMTRRIAPRRTRCQATTTRVNHDKLIFSNTLSEISA
jgi:hypothetical protein